MIKSGKKFFRGLLFLSCFIIVTWQCLKAFEKYQKKPKGTNLSTVNTAKNIFPSVTFCSRLEDTNFFYNKTVLQNCGLKDGFDIKNRANWVGRSENISCTDPKILFESVVVKPEDLITKLQGFCLIFFKIDKTLSNLQSIIIQFLFSFSST